MAKRLSAPVRVLLIVCAVLAGVVIALQLILNSGLVSKAVDNFARERLDGTLAYNDISFSVIGAFPNIRANVDSLSLTYPHSRFADRKLSDSLSLSGTGAESDTLASFDRLSVTLSPFRLLMGKIHIDHAAVHGLSLHAHAYSDSTANWQILRASGDTASAGGRWPAISIKEFLIDKDPEIVYTDDKSELYADMGLSVLWLGGTFCKEREGFALKKAELYVDASSRLSSGRFRNLDIPVLLDARASVKSRADSLKLNLSSLMATVAHIPLTVSGTLSHIPDSIYLDLDAAVDSLQIGTILRQYGAAVSSVLPYFTTDAKLNMDLEADGWLSKNSLPQLDLKLTVPESEIDYTPRHMRGRMALDCTAALSEEGEFDARVDRLSVSIPGTTATVNGTAENLLSGNPLIRGRIAVSSVLESLTGYILHDAGIDASGDLDLYVDADAHLADMDKLHFRNATLAGGLSGGRICVSLQGNGAKVNAFRPRITLSSDPRGAGIGIILDSLYYSAGDSLAARVRGLSAKTCISQVPYRDAYVPRTETAVSARSLFFKTDALKVGVRGADISMLCRKRLEKRIVAGPDSSSRFDFPGMVPPLDTNGMPVPPPDDRLVKVRLDSALIAEFRKWSMDGSVGLGRGFIATPSLPLRTRLGGAHLSFDSNRITLDSISVTSGTSDLEVNGKVSGIRRFSKHRGRLSLDLEVRSDRINLNELISAVQIGGKEKLDTAVASEKDESFVTDTLENARPERRGRRFLLPPFIDGSVGLEASEVNYLDLTARPLRLSAQMYDKVLKLGELSSDFGETEFSFSGYYSTRSPEDISLGIDADIRKAPVNQSLRILRGYDSLSPIVRSIDGKVDLQASLTAGLDGNLNVKPSTIGGMARLSGQDVFINDAGDLRRITKLLFFKNKDIGHVDDFHVDAVLRDGKLEVYPFYISADRYKLALQGIQGLDRSLNWYASVLKSPFLIPFGVKVFGNFDKLRFSLATARYLGKKNLPVYTSQLDSIHINVAKTIDRVYSEGVGRALRYSSSYIRRAASASSGSDGAVTDTLSRSAIDSLTRKGVPDSLAPVRLDVEKLEEEFNKIRNGKQ